MSWAGDLSRWVGLFPDGLVPEIIDLVLDAWYAFPQPRPRPDDLENPITIRFCTHLRSHRTARNLPVNIDTECSEIDARQGRLAGRIDIRLTRHGDYEDIYFAIECKRLNVVSANGKRSSLAREYVDKGMMRFIEGKYAKGLDKGGMLGYVMDGKVTDAVNAVDIKVREFRKELRMHRANGLLSSSVRPSEKGVKETHHKVQANPFVIHHIFMAVA